MRTTTRTKLAGMGFAAVIALAGTACAGEVGGGGTDTGQNDQPQQDQQQQQDDGGGDGLY